MINHVTHERYDITPELILNRDLRLTFTGGVLSKEIITGFGATFSVLSIDGVGEGYAGDFVSEGIQTLGDLVQIDPLAPVGNIPPVKLRDFRAKARMVLGLQATLAPFEQLSHHTISNLLIQRPEDIVGEIESPVFTTEMVTRLQEELALLQIALDNSQLQNILLGDLINT